MEIVFKPELFDGDEAASLVRELCLVLRAVASCTCQMDEGALRVDANISIRKPGQSQLGIRTEVKNLNSLRFVRGAIEAEVERQIDVLEAGGIVENETRGYDVQAKQTVPMRDKEVKQDYRFMPEPNLPPLRLKKEDIQRQPMPKLPKDIRRELQHQQFSLEHSAVTRLMENPDQLDYFRQVMEIDSSFPEQAQLPRSCFWTKTDFFTNVTTVTFFKVEEAEEHSRKYQKIEKRIVFYK